MHGIILAMMIVLGIGGAILGILMVNTVLNWRYELDRLRLHSHLREIEVESDRAVLQAAYRQTRAVLLGLATHSCAQPGQVARDVLSMFCATCGAVKTHAAQVAAMPLCERCTNTQAALYSEVADHAAITLGE